MEARKEELYKGCRIISWIEEYEVFDKKKEKWRKRKQIYCHLYRKNGFLNLGECNDGGAFTAINQAVNEAKYLVDYKIEREIDLKLLRKGVPREVLNKYNSLRIWDRIKEKEKLF